MSNKQRVDASESTGQRECTIWENDGSRHCSTHKVTWHQPFASDDCPKAAEPPYEQLVFERLQKLAERDAGSATFDHREARVLMGHMESRADHIGMLEMASQPADNAAGSQLTEGNEQRRCSFCGRKRENAGGLITAEETAICSVCVRASMRLLGISEAPALSSLGQRTETDRNLGKGDKRLDELLDNLEGAADYRARAVNDEGEGDVFGAGSLIVNARNDIYNYLEQVGGCFEAGGQQ